MVLRIGRLKKVIIKTNINNFKYLKTSKKFCGYTAGFTNSSGDWDGRTRFVDNRDGTVTDKLTGLMWVKDFDLKGKQTWYDGVRIVKKCRVGGYTNWRLPQVREIETLIDFNKYNPALPDGHPFINVKRGYYWTGTEYSSSEDYAWFIIMVNGSLYSYDKNEKFRLIFCRKK